MQERFLAVQDRRISALAKLLAFKLPCPHTQLDGADQGRVGVRLEIRIDEVGYLATPHSIRSIADLVRLIAEEETETSENATPVEGEEEGPTSHVRKLPNSRT
jgi:hypothetical protein